MDASGESSFLKQDNLTDALFQKRIFGMGNYNKVLPEYDVNRTQ